MDAQSLLEQLLESGKKIALQGRDLADKGLDMAAEKLGTEEGESRDKMKSNIGKGLAAGGLLAVLLGTKTGRRLAIPALKIGSIAALGAIGYKVYDNWKKQKGIASEGESLENLSGEAAEQRSMLVVRAMIGAAKADGHIDETEQAAIVDQIKQADMESKATQILLSEIQKPLDIDDLAEGVDSIEAAVEVYLGSLVVVDRENPKERTFLDQLSRALKLDPELVQHLESEIATS